MPPYVLRLALLVSSLCLAPQALAQYTFNPATGPSDGETCTLLTTGDFNKDGRTDVATVWGGGGAIYVTPFLRQPAGSPEPFLKGTRHPLGPALAHLRAADVNGDGNLDLVAVYNQLTNIGANAVDVLPGAGDGTFGEAVRTPLAQRPEGVDVADFNRDGKSDLVYSYSTGRVYTSAVLLSNGAGGFTENPVKNFGVLESPAIRATDMNGDGIMDLVFIVQTTYGNGDGTFSGVDFSVNKGNGFGRLVVGEFDNDGKTDLLTYTVPSNSNAEVSFYSGLDRVASSSIALNPWIVPGNFNNDAFGDFLIISRVRDSLSQSHMQISAFVGGGSPVARFLINIAHNAIPTIVEPFDFNGDGRTDMASALGALGWTYYVNNALPVAQAQNVTVVEDTQAEVTLSATDAEGDPFTIHIVTPPNHGHVTAVDGNRVTYTPNLDYVGPDNFIYNAVYSPGQESNFANVTLNVTPVNDPPWGAEQTFNAYRDHPLTFAPSVGDKDGDPLTLAVATPPAHGAVTADGLLFTYTPEPGYTGPDSFTYTVSDGGLTSTAYKVTLAVNLSLVNIGSATTVPGEPAETVISTTQGVSDFVGFEIRLRAVGPEGVPPPVPNITQGADTQGWFITRDPNGPGHVIIGNSSPLQGKKELLRVHWTVNPNVPPGTLFKLEAQSAVFTNLEAKETEVAAQTAPGTLNIVSVAGCQPRQKGDTTGDGQIDIRDAIGVLRSLVGLEPSPDECVLKAMDVNCDGEIKIGDVVLILRNIVFQEPFPACP